MTNPQLTYHYSTKSPNKRSERYINGVEIMRKHLYALHANALFTWERKWVNLFSFNQSVNEVCL